MKVSQKFCLFIGLCFNFSMQSVFAADIKIEGEITNITCSVKINGIPGSLSIALPAVKATDFGGHNSKAGTTEYTLELYGCSEIYKGYAVKVASRPFRRLVPGIGATERKPEHYLGNMATVNAAKGVHFYLEGQYSDGFWDSIYSPVNGVLVGVLVDHFMPSIGKVVQKGRVSYVRDTSPESGSETLVGGIVQSAVQYSLIYN